MDCDKTRLIVTIDTECDKDKGWHTTTPIQFMSVTSAIPNLLCKIFDEFTIRPTYLLSPEIIANIECVTILNELKNCEIGTHLHGDYIVPQIKRWNFEGSITDEMQWEYNVEIEQQKLAVLTELFSQQFGFSPKSFRAGRFGIGHQTVKLLVDLGYHVDSSVTPHIVWTSRHGAKSPDFRGLPEIPYTVGAEGDIWEPGSSHFLEVPITILKPGAIPSQLPQEPIWFRPWYSDDETLHTIMRHVAAEPSQQGQRRPLVMMFHSVELVPGASPYPQTKADVSRYLDTLKRVFQWAEELGIKSCTLQEYYQEYVTAQRVPSEAREASPSSEVRVNWPKSNEALKKEVGLPTDLVEPILDRHHVQPWFKYIYRERSTRWDVWQPCFWVAQHYPSDAPILSTGCGVGFNLMWLAEHGFRHLYGFDIDERAIAAGVEIYDRAKLPLHLWVDDGLNPQWLPEQKFSVIEFLNWTMLIPALSVERLLEKYLPYLADDGVLIFDSVDASYNEVPNNQYLTSDWGKPVEQRRATEYKTRIAEAELRSMLQSRGLTIAETFHEEEMIPRKVYVIGRSEAMQGQAKAPQVDAQRLPKASSSGASRPRILLIADVPDWIFARHCKMLERYLADEFDIKTVFHGDFYDEDDYDLIYPLEWNLVKPEQIRTPAKYITGIRSHLHWPNLDFFAFVNFLSTHFQRVHVVSERLHRMFAPFLPTVTYVTHGIDTTFFTPSTQADQLGGKVRIGWAGNRNSSENKGFKDIIEPLGRLPGVELVFCGYSDKNLSMAEMRQFYDTIDIYVCASVNEGSNNSLLEAAAMERAIITTENGTVSEYLKDGDSAIIVERHLPLFIQAVQTLRDDPARCAALGKRARQAVLQGWDWRDKAADYRAFFKEALATQVEHLREKLNILLIAHGFPPQAFAGTELYTYHLARELLKRGHAVRVLYPEYETHRAAGDVIEDSYDGVPITRLNLRPSPDMMRDFNNEEAASAFGRYVANLNVDVVHFQHLIGLSAAALGVCTQQHIPTALTLHDAWTLCEQTHLLKSDGTFCSGPETVDKCVQCLVSRYPQHSLSDHLPELFYITAARRQFIQRMLAGLDALLVPTQFLQRLLAAYDLEHPRTVFAPLGLPSFSTLPWQPSTGPLRLTFLGNITYTKGVDVAIRAFNLIEPEKACLSLYGAVADTAYWHRVVAEVEPRHQVEHHGAYTPADLPEILARTDVAVIPSRAENYPTVIRECLHAGVPVIGSNVGGVPEIIQDGVNGFLFEANDHKDLAAKLQFFIRNPEQVNVFRQRIQPVWSIAEDAATLEGLYREILMQKADAAQEETLGSTPHAGDSAAGDTALANGSTAAARVQLRLRSEQESELRQQGDHDGVLECSVIIPVFNKVELTKQCLMHLSQVTQGVEYEVLVVDNASSDGTPEFLAALSGDVQIISNDANLGFAKACNQGARAAKGRYLVFLNNDTIPLEGWLAAMVDEVKTHPEVVVVGSKLLYPDDTIQHAGVVFTRAGFLPYHVYSRVPADVGVVNRRREFQVVTAACMLVRKEMFEAVGGFDEGYRNGFEDVDLCLKIRDQGGRVVYQPKSVLYHLESQTPGRKDHDQENAKRLLGRWGDRWLVDEDVVCGGDGFAIRTIQENGRTSTRLESLGNTPDKTSWERVAEVERLTLAGDIEAVRPLLARIDLWPEDLGALRWAAQVCMRIGVPEYAEAFWRHMLKYEGVFDAREGLARLAMERGAFDEAEEHLKVLSSQGDGESWIIQGVLALQRQRYTEAADAFKAALQNGANSRKVQLGLGMATMGLGQMDRAWEHFATVLSDEIDDAEAIHCLLRAGAALERWRPLADYLVNYLRLNPGDSSVRFALAGVHVRLEDWEGAREAYEMIRLLDPTFEGLDDLAQILARQTYGVNA